MKILVIAYSGQELVTGHCPTEGGCLAIRRGTMMRSINSIGLSVGEGGTTIIIFAYNSLFYFLDMQSVKTEL